MHAAGPGLRSLFFSFLCPVIRNMVTEHHNLASRIILKVVSEYSCGSNLIQIGVGSADCLAQHDLHITEQFPNRIIPPYLFDPTIPDQARRTSIRPDAILVTPCPANPNRPPTPPSHRVLRSMNVMFEEARSSTTTARQLHELNIQNCHIHFIQIRYREDKRPGIDPQRSIKLARKLHVHSVQHAQNFNSTRRAIEIKNTQHNSGAQGPRAARNPPDPH
eukprot:563474-Pelagomonas_calceolata.AAC.1